MPPSLLFLLILLLLVGTSCRVQNQEPNTSRPNQIVFGRGGGFTGQVKTYHLLEDGQFYLTNSLDSDTVFLENVSSIEVEGYFERLLALNLSQRSFSRPGNIYYFIRQRHSKGDAKVVWGDESNPTPTDIQDYWDSLMVLVKSTKK